MARNDANTVIAAFTEEQVERLTGISVRQLRYWDSTDFFAPSLAYENRRAPFSRVYTFRDLLCLKVLNTLRNESRCSLPHLRDVKVKLAHMGDDLWVKTTLYVLNRKVVFVNPETKNREEVVTGQGVLQIPLKVVHGDMQRAVANLRQREEQLIGKVQRKRNVAHNKPVIAGTRIPVSAVKAFSEAGYTIAQIKEQYPTLTDEDISAALSYSDAA
jgi:uncharacterized protein (DUF433 family)